MRNILLLSVLVTFAACSSTEIIRMNVQEPAPVTLPAYAKSAGVLNRTDAESKFKVLDVLDKVLSLEGDQLDKQGAAASIERLKELLVDLNKFTVVESVTAKGITGATGDVIPAPLSWQQVKELCADHNVDLLFSLEFFDTNSSVSYSVANKTVNTPLGKVPVPEHTATMLTLVNTGWRIYDPQSQTIIDEVRLSNDLRFYGKGINPAAALEALTSRAEAVKETGAKVGEKYGWRIMPYTARIARKYYVRGSDEFRMARRKAQTGNWDGAAALWEKETTHEKSKVAGRACYNMAIIGEINGDLDEAIKWSQTAYEQHNNKLALDYIKILERRKIINESLNESQANR